MKFLDTPRTAVALAMVTVAVDLACVSNPSYGEVRACFAMITFASAVYLSGGDLKSLGLRRSPVQGWSRWISVSFKIGSIVAACVIIGLSTWYAVGYKLNLHVTHPSAVSPRFIAMCFVAPMIEEAVYRFSACGLMAAVLGNNRTIALNGVLFGFLHVLYGNPSPENLVGGFFLAWAFLKSETILMPLALHSVGNLLALVAQIGGWFLMGETG